MVITKVLLALMPAVALASSCLNEQEVGTIKGTVKIGPLRPAQRVGEVEVIPPEMFGYYRVVVYRIGQKKEMMRVKITQKGTYEVKLPAGTYEIAGEHAENQMKMGYRRTKVVVHAGKTVTQALEIDTGIR